MTRLAFLAAFVLCLASGPSKAASFYTFSFLGSFSASGTFETDGVDGVNGGQVINASGVVNGLPITGWDGGITLTPAYHYITFFSSEGRAVFYNYPESGDTGALFPTKGDPTYSAGTFTINQTLAPVPLPASASLFGLALLMLAMIGFSKAPAQIKTRFFDRSKLLGVASQH